jgi:hypothetical protein
MTPQREYKFRFLYLTSTQSMLWCIYSSDGGGRCCRTGAGSKLRHWPPGTNSKTVRAVFFCLGGLAHTGWILLLRHQFWELTWLRSGPDQV